MLTLLCSLVLLQGPAASAQGVSMTLPKGFVLLDAKSPAILKSINAAAKKNPQIAQLANLATSQTYAIVGVDRAGISGAVDFLDNVNVVVRPGPDIPMDASAAPSIAAHLKQSIPGLVVKEQKLISLPVGKVAYIRSTWTLTNTNGRKVPLVVRTYATLKNRKLVVVTYTNAVQSEAKQAPSINASMRSLRIL